MFRRARLQETQKKKKMSKISTYATVTPIVSDKVIGTDVAGTPTDATKNFTAGSIAALAATAGVLTLPAYADQAAAGAALASGSLFQQTGTGIVMVVI